MKHFKIPSYSHHKASGQARVYINRKPVYLGAYGSEQSRIRYAEIISKLASGVPLDSFASKGEPPETCLTINEFCLAFLRHAVEYYSKDRRPNAEVDCLKSAIRPLVNLFGENPADKLTPLMMKAVREKYIEAGWSRGFCNRSVNRIRHIWKWGVENGMISVTTLHALQAISPLKAGKCAAPDYKKREAIPTEDIEAVRLQLSQRDRDALDLLLLTGARPSELLRLDASKINRAGDVWSVELTDHKNAHRGKTRTLYFGPKAQEILNRYPSTGKLLNIRRDSFSSIIKLACQKAKVSPFVPYQLRHTKATELRDTIGIEAAQATLGHSQPNMTARYSSKLDKLAAQVALQTG